MYFLLAMVCALIGMGFILYWSPVKQSHMGRPLIDTDVWIESIHVSFQTKLRTVLRFIVVHLVQWYRYITRDITIHTTMKKKVRELLYEHHKENSISPSKKSKLFDLKK